MGGREGGGGGSDGPLGENGGGGGSGLGVATVGGNDRSTATMPPEVPPATTKKRTMVIHQFLENARGSVIPEVDFEFEVLRLAFLGYREFLFSRGVEEAEFSGAVEECAAEVWLSSETNFNSLHSSIHADVKTPLAFLLNCSVIL